MDIESIKQKLSEEEYHSLHMRNADKAVAYLYGFPEIEGYKPIIPKYDHLDYYCLAERFYPFGDFRKIESKYVIIFLFLTIVYQLLKKNEINSIQDILNDQNFIDDITDCMAVMNLKSNEDKTKIFIQMVYHDIINEPIE